MKTIDWEPILSDNRKAVESFAAGSSARSMISQLKTEEAKSAVYALERVPVAKARSRAKSALRRKSR